MPIPRMKPIDWFKKFADGEYKINVCQPLDEVINAGICEPSFENNHICRPFVEGVKNSICEPSFILEKQVCKIYPPGCGVCMICQIDRGIIDPGTICPIDPGIRNKIEEMREINIKYYEKNLENINEIKSQVIKILAEVQALQKTEVKTPRRE
jgi:hypothetical protein